MEKVQLRMTIGDSILGGMPKVCKGGNISRKNYSGMVEIKVHSDKLNYMK